MSDMESGRPAPTRRRRKKKADSAMPVTHHLEFHPPEDGLKSLTLHAGEQLFSPKQYHSFRVGGHDVTVVLLPGETVAEMVTRGRNILTEIVDAEFAYELETFRRRYKESHR